MDILKRKLAPISDEAWDEIDEAAKDVLKNILTARKVLKINGPKGWDYNAVPEGRLEYIEDNKEGVCTGTYQLKRLLEARRSFTLNKWELDNIGRGAKDIDLDNLEEAVEELARFEDDVLYNGYKKAEIIGLADGAEHQLKMGKEGNEILKSIGEGCTALKESYVEGPLDLIVSPKVYENLTRIFDGYYLYDAVKRIIGGKIVRSDVVKGAILIPHREEDIEFTVGQDFSIGYEKEDAQTVTLFVTESFTLRLLDPAKIVNFK
ncbi:MAG: family 1 encapsulin nanocompartment shell protein [Tissierellia bacterium]|nr:family 1 encapsulin nanocompartment shell protein [Tissierellia bacterium]